MTAALQQSPDSALVARMMTGDESALSALYDRYSPQLLGMLMRVLNDRHAAEEVLQDVFFQLWSHPARFDASRGALLAWLMVIARNRAISRLRGRRDRELLEEDEGDFASTFASTQNMEDETLRAQLAHHVTAALEKLAPEQRQAIELAYFEGMSHSEIAAKTGAPLGTVKTRVRTAMQSLRQLLV